jgi:hypothetical protein
MSSWNNMAQCPNLDCGDMSPLSDWQTCLPVPKRSHACAHQIKTSPNMAAVTDRRHIETKMAREDARPTKPPLTRRERRKRAVPIDAKRRVQPGAPKNWC